MTKAGKDYKHWSQVAEEWLAWARKPNHDAFWAYRASLATFICRGNGRALDVGCGEGRISRELTACGFQVTAVDPVSQFVGAAIEAQSARNYAVASATELPFENAQFDLVVAYNVLMDVDDVPSALKEFRRVIRPAGQLIISIAYPLMDYGHFASKEMNSPFCPRRDLLRQETLRRCGGARWLADAFCWLESTSRSLWDSARGGRTRDHVTS